MKHFLIIFLNYLIHSSSQKAEKEANGTVPQDTVVKKKYTHVAFNKLHFLLGPDQVQELYSTSEAITATCSCRTRANKPEFKVGRTTFAWDK
jgi:hypothetical protein